MVRLDVVQFLLGIEEVASDGIVDNSLALLFKIVDFLTAEGWPTSAPFLAVSGPWSTRFSYCARVFFRLP